MNSCNTIRSIPTKPIMYFIIPLWLDNTMKAKGISEASLVDDECCTTILTAEDVSFYNDGVKAINGLTSMKAPEMSYLYEVDGRIPLSSSLVDSSNSISLENVIDLFVENNSEEGFSNIILKYNVFSLENFHMVSVRLEPCDPSLCKEDEQRKEDEKLAEFYISEYGMSAFATSELFDKVITG